MESGELQEYRSPSGCKHPFEIDFINLMLSSNLHSDAYRDFAIAT